MTNIKIIRTDILPHKPCESGLAAFDAAAPDGTLEGDAVSLLRAHPALARFWGWARYKGLVGRDVLVGANFTDADLTHANFTDADLTHANLIDANLTPDSNAHWLTCRSCYPRHSTATRWPAGWTPLTEPT